MGKINFKKIFKELNCSKLKFQKKSFEKILALFFISDIKFFSLTCTEGIGVRGKYDGVENNQVEVKFNYFEFYFEFYISFDQLEFYIYFKEKLIDECNVEDYWDEETHIEKFINHLKKSLIKLKIPYNENI